MDDPRCIAGDSRREESYAQALRGERAGLLLTDPPYCLLTRRRKGGDLRDKRSGVKIDQEPIGRFESVRDYRLFTEEWLTRAVAHLEPQAPLIIWTNFLGKEPIRTVARGLGYAHLAGEFVWAKWSSQREGNEQLLRVYEVALVLTREPLPLLAPSDLPRSFCVAAGYDDEGEAERWGSHPNHKPFGVIEPLVRTYSHLGAVVLDPFAGSGSIPAAAVRLGRRAACIELEPEWAARVTTRLRTATKPQAAAESRTD